VIRAHAQHCIAAVKIPALAEEPAKLELGVLRSTRGGALQPILT